MGFAVVELQLRGLAGAIGAGIGSRPCGSHGGLGEESGDHEAAQGNRVHSAHPRHTGHTPGTQAAPFYLPYGVAARISSNEKTGTGEETGVGGRAGGRVSRRKKLTAAGPAGAARVARERLAGSGRAGAPAGRRQAFQPPVRHSRCTSNGATPADSTVSPAGLV